MKRWILWSFISIVTMSVGVRADETASTDRYPKPLFAEDFSKTEAGEIPDTLMILDGDFAVKKDGDDSYLELPGTPLSTFGLLFGPRESSGVMVSARIRGEAMKRLTPRFGVGLNGVSGYKLQVTPAKRALELYQGDEVIQSVEYKWKPGIWTFFRLQIHRTGEKAWKVEGQAWQEGEKQPENWLLTCEITEEPIVGQASLWGTPYAGKPIQYDDICIVPLESEKRNH